MKNGTFRFATLLVVLGSLAHVSNAYNTSYWVRGNSTAWSSRSGHAWTYEIINNNTVISVLAGGALSSGTLLNDVWVAQTSIHQNWTNYRVLTYTANWSPRFGAAMSYLDGSLILTAGKATNGDCLQDVWISTDGVNWALGPLPGWAPRHGHRMVVVDGLLILLGGETQVNGVHEYLKDMWYMNNNDNTWVRIVENPGAWFQERAYFGAAVHNGKLYISGGGDGSLEMLGDVWMYNNDNTWSSVPVTSSNDCLSRAGHVLVATDRLWLFGGYGSGTVPAPVCWSITGGVWSPTPHHMNNVDALHRKYLTVTLNGNGFVLVGGEVNETAVTSLWWIFRPCNLDCSEHGVCVLGDTADLPVSCKCDVGYLPPYCTPKPPSSWDSFVAWLKGPAWHVVVFSFGVFMVLVGFAYVAVKWFNGNHAVFHNSNNPRSSLDMSLLERFGEDWVIEAKHVKYNTSHPIGSGGFAQVYKGTYNGSAVAVKVIHAFLLSTPDKRALYVRRFADEADTMRKLHHPHVQPLIGVVLEPVFALVTDLAPFGSLSDVLDASAGWSFRGSSSHTLSISDDESSHVHTRLTSPRSSTMSSPLLSFSPQVALKMAYEIACGVRYLHAKGFTHRDLNTNNVLVYCLEYDRLLVRVSDFGLSRELATGVQMTMTGFIGSPAYIAPEVLGQNARYDEKADVYSFGVLLWTLAQHLFLCSQRERRLNPDEHRFLLKPYGNWAPMQVLKCVAGGTRPSPPPPMFPFSQVFLDLMVRCWDQDPTARPSFPMIMKYLRSAIEESIGPLQDDVVDVELDDGVSEEKHDGDGDVVGLRGQSQSGLNQSLLSDSDTSSSPRYLNFKPSPSGK